MRLGYFIRLGDKTSCGGTVLGGERGVTLLGVPRAREGDRVSCGKHTGEFHIVGGVDQLKSHGRRVAGSLDSTSSCACNALLIPSSFTTQYESLRSVKPRHAVVPRPTTSQNCGHPDQLLSITTYMADEINRNVRHPTVGQIRQLNRYDATQATHTYQALPWHARWWARDPRRVAKACKDKAVALWVEQMDDNREWNYRAKVAQLQDSSWHKQGRYLYHVGLWAGIHYGYLGMAAGFRPGVLVDGIDEHTSLEQRRTLRHWRTPADRLAINIGVELYKRYPEGVVTGKALLSVILAADPQSWGAGRREHRCGSRLRQPGASVHALASYPQRVPTM
ncbi:PAAR domain-containing protein [Pseudomonas coleopterorum]|uniref:Polymorphic toxin type 44 domain-containing protein n=1 Tax=Pseudomonas coleopterorum TaxID=1605838 RepID=A0AAJ6MU32_9PSED|nr:PAAR domain-containing protein [Pseudomonas coleopterorum]WNC10273.1 polymorphic toxin type 44 domain-containing protein [Pseudomonas coleopterorum]